MTPFFSSPPLLEPFRCFLRRFLRHYYGHYLPSLRYLLLLRRHERGQPDVHYSPYFRRPCDISFSGHYAEFFHYCTFRHSLFIIAVYWFANRLTFLLLHLFPRRRHATLTFRPPSSFLSPPLFVDDERRTDTFMPLISDAITPAMIDFRRRHYACR